MGKKKFIDKKKSATFQLLARDSSDPNYQDSPGHDRIFIRVDNNPYSVDGIENETEDVSGPEGPDSIFADAPDDVSDDGVLVNRSSSLPSIGATSAGPLPDHIRREILEMGFPDDGYNYLLHLREIRNTGGGSVVYHNSKARLDQVPLDVKAYDASKVHVGNVKNDPDEKVIYSVAEKTVGVRVQKALDPDVAALLDSDDFPTSDLEEDFVLQANVHEEGEEEEEEEEEEDDDDDVSGQRSGKEDVDGNAPQESQEDLVEFMGRHAQVRNDYFGAEDDNDVAEKARVRGILDEQFDQLELMEYGTESDDDYGGSVGEDYVSLANKLNCVLKDHVEDDVELEQIYRVPADFLHGKEGLIDSGSLDSHADVLRRCVEYAEKYENEDPGKDVVVFEESSDESEGWDCETVLTTYSNLDNHPGRIEAPGKRKLGGTVSGPIISLRGKEKLPVDFLPRGRKSLTEKAKVVTSLKTEQQRRKKHGQEEKEEKKERKAVVKEERREARRVKKETKEMYKSETQRALRAAAISGPSAYHLP